MKFKQPTLEHVAQADGTWSYSLDILKKNKLQELASHAVSMYTGGFYSEVNGRKVLFDSTEIDQQNIVSMWSSAQSPNFETDPTYKGFIPIRGLPEGTSTKVVVNLNKVAMQQLVDDLNRHIGLTKITHWMLQERIASATSREELDAIHW